MTAPSPGGTVHPDAVAWEPEWIGRQFGLPRGLLGRMAGWLMAVGNADMEREAIEQLALAGHERALEIGCGPGVGLQLLSGRLPTGWAAGIDPSLVMVEQARRRCRRAIAAGRVDVRVGTVSALP